MPKGGWAVGPVDATGIASAFYRPVHGIAPLRPPWSAPTPVATNLDVRGRTRSRCLARPRTRRTGEGANTPCPQPMAEETFCALACSTGNRMEVLAFFGCFGFVIVAVLWFALSATKQISVAQHVEERKDELWAKAVRDTFIADPLGSNPDDFADRVLDHLSRTSRIHDRTQLRGAVEALAPSQVGEYIRFAEQHAVAAVMALSGADRESLTFSALKEQLRAAITSRQVDELARLTGEQIDDAVGLRRALLERAAWSVLPFSNVVSGSDDWIPTRGVLVWPCPHCDLLMRDMARNTCRGCGHDFQDPASAKRSPLTASE